jgi:hypothetical protein
VAILRQRQWYTPLCIKENHSITGQWRHQLANNLIPIVPEDPEDPGTPSIVLYGANAELRMRNVEQVPGGFEAIVYELYGPAMSVAKIPSTHWARNGTTTRPNEQASVFETVILPPTGRDEGIISAHNWAIRDEVQKARNMDKGFSHFVSHYRPYQPVIASFSVEQGLYGEWRWGIFFQQSRHRCIMAGVVSNRPEEEAREDALWTAAPVSASFEPIPGQPKEHPGLPYFPEESTHFFEGNGLTDLSETELYQNASPYRKALIEDFCRGCQKFTREIAVADILQGGILGRSRFIQDNEEGNRREGLEETVRSPLGTSQTVGVQERREAIRNRDR